jgi:DNA repair exonuclease SbcCD nuclease subunit
MVLIESFPGHFHVRATNGRIQYIGNPYQTNWGEANDKKGFLVFDTKTDTVEFVQNPIDIYKTISILENVDVINFDVFEYSDCIVRIIVEANSNVDRRALDSLVDRLSATAHSVEVIDEYQINSNADDIDEDVTTDTGVAIQQFLDSHTISGIDKTKLTEMAFDIYKTALEIQDA